MNNIKDLEMSPTLKWFKHCFAPQAVFINLVDQRYTKHTSPHKPGSTLLFNLYGVNDYPGQSTGKVILKLINSDGAVVTQQDISVNLAPFLKNTIPCVLALPNETGGYLLVAEYHPEGNNETVISRRYLKIGDPPNEKYDFYELNPF